MADGVIALQVFPGSVQVRRRVRVAGQDKLGKVKWFRIAGVVFDRAAQRPAPRFAGLQLIHQSIWEGGGLELEAMHIDPLPNAVKHNEVTSLRPRLGVVIEEVEERVGVSVAVLPVEVDYQSLAGHGQPNPILNGFGRGSDEYFLLQHDAPSIGFSDLIMRRIEIAPESIEVALGVEGHSYTP